MGLSKQLYEEIEQFARQAIDGEIDEIKALLEMKEFEEFIKSQKELMEKPAMRLVQLEKDGKTIRFGYNISCQQKTTWKYDHIKAWANKKAELKDIEEKAKAAYLLSARNLDNSMSDFEGYSIEKSEIDIETGEIVEKVIIEPAVRNYSEPFLKIEKAKEAKK